MEALALLITVITTALCWGSFLNVVAYRLSFDKPFFTKRSYCPSCNKTIAWYDNIPLISWILLAGKCRHCKKKISWVYPFTELFTAILFTALFFHVFQDIRGFINLSYLLVLTFCAYALFFTSLIISTAMDFRALVVSQLFTMWFIPLGLTFAFFDVIKISPLQSSLGALLGYGVLWLVAFVFKKIKKQEGMGVGDMELLAMIGSFLGPYGVWASLMLGSVSGAIFGGLYIMITKKKRTTRIPFGPFLSLGAILYFFFERIIMRYLF